MDKGTDVEVDVEDRIDEKSFSDMGSSTDYYNTWDLNEDNYLDENEFSEGYYNLWDLDNNETIEREEWDKNINTFKDRANEVLTWETSDLNQNNRVEKNEFEEAFNQLRYYMDWDKDKNEKVDKNEFLGGLFSDIDLNKDGFLDRDEYDDNFFDIDLKKDLDVSK